MSEILKNILRLAPRSPSHLRHLITTLAATDAHAKASLDTFAAYVTENGVDLAKTQLKLGRELTLDPQTERSSDAEANALFTREYRQGYELPRV